MYEVQHIVCHIFFIAQAFVGLERGQECFSNPVYPDDDGLELLKWDGACLTYEGEINKLATNVAFGRYGGPTVLNCE